MAAVTAQDHSDRPEGETGIERGARARRRLRLAPRRAQSPIPDDEDPAHHEPSPRDAAHEAQLR